MWLWTHTAREPSPSCSSVLAARMRAAASGLLSPISFVRLPSCHPASSCTVCTLCFSRSGTSLSARFSRSTTFSSGSESVLACDSLVGALPSCACSTPASRAASMACSRLALSILECGGDESA
eukprot:584694-Prymnesium_polylepis.1